MTKQLLTLRSSSTLLPLKKDFFAVRIPRLDHPSDQGSALAGISMEEDVVARSLLLEVPIPV